MYLYIDSQRERERERERDRATCLGQAPCARQDERARAPAWRPKIGSLKLQTSEVCHWLKGQHPWLHQAGPWIAWDFCNVPGSL